MATFEITRPIGSVRLDEDRRAPVPFAVTNLSTRPIRARLDVVPTSAADRSVFTIDGEAERTLQPNESHAVRVLLAATPATPAGAHTFQLKVVDTDRPDDIFAISQPVEFIVAPPVVQTWRFWWLIPAGVLLILLAGAVWYGMSGPAADPDTLTFANAGIVSNQTARPLVLADARVLLVERTASLRSLNPILEQIARDKVPLVIIGPVDQTGVDGVARAPEEFRFVIINVPGSSEEQRKLLERIVAFSGARLYPDDRRLENARLEELGTVSRISVDDKSSTLWRRPTPASGGGS